MGHHIFVEDGCGMDVPRRAPEQMFGQAALSYIPTSRPRPSSQEGKERFRLKAGLSQEYGVNLNRASKRCTVFVSWS